MNKNKQSKTYKTEKQKLNLITEKLLQEEQDNDKDLQKVALISYLIS